MDTQDPAAAPRALPLRVLGAVAAAYAGVVQAGFVWDDVPLVVDNLQTGDLANLPRFFAEDLWASTPGHDGGSGYYRPLMLTSLAVERAVYGLWAPGHHLHSLAWHLLGVWALMRLGRPALGGWGAAVAGLVMGLHPMQSEAVVWIAARNDPMAAALGLLALERVAWARPGATGRLTVGGLLTLLAGLAKESVVLLPGMLLVIDLVGGRRPRLGPYLALGGGIGAVLLLRLLVGVDASGAPAAVGWSLVLRESPRLVGLLATRVVVPWPLHSGMALEWIDRVPVWRWAVGLGALPVGIGVAVAAARRGERGALVGLAWAALAAAPVIVPIADKGLVGERYLYLSIAGVGWMLGAGAGPRLLLAVGALALPAIAAIQVRVPDWRTDRTLWDAALARLETPYTLGSVGHTRMDAGEVAAAFELYTRAIDDRRPDLSVCANLVRAGSLLGNPPLAAQTGRWSARRGCDGAAFRGRYALALVAVGEVEEAGAVFAPVPTAAWEGAHVLVRGTLARLAGDVAGEADALGHPAAPPDALERIDGLTRAAESATIPAGGRP